jgi:hypothetical protein
MNVRDSRALLIARLEKAAPNDTSGEDLVSSPACQAPLANDPQSSESPEHFAAQDARKPEHVA